MTLADRIRALPRDARLALYRSLQGEPGALARLVEPIETELVAVAVRLTGSREDAALALEAAAAALRSEPRE